MSEFDVWKLHIYFFQKNQKSLDAAKILQGGILEKIKAKYFSAVGCGQLVDKPEGPHPCGHFEVTCPASELARVMGFLTMHRQNLSILLRPVSRQLMKDFSERGWWLGPPVSLDLSALDAAADASAVKFADAGPASPRSPRAAPAASPRGDLTLKLAGAQPAEDLSASLSRVLSPRKQLEAVEPSTPLSFETRTMDLLEARMPIVNSANNWLRMGSGTSGLIKEAAGDFIQHECDKIIAANKGQPIPIGSAVVTKSGAALEKLNIHYIIHAVGMGYGDPKDIKSRIPATAESVALCVTSALEAAERIGVPQLAFPFPMCSRPGYHAVVPADNAPRVMGNAMIEAIRKFKARKLKKVILCQPANYNK